MKYIYVYIPHRGQTRITKLFIMVFQLCVLALIMRGQACTWETFLEILFLRVLAQGTLCSIKRYHKNSVYAQYKRDERSNIVMKVIGERRHSYKLELYSVQEAVVNCMTLFNISNAKGKI
jgi:hypothetical protein